jgi:TonB family protein
MAPDEPEVTTSVRTIGRYRIFEELGRGAMGVVYRGFDPVIGRTVALKTLTIHPEDAHAKVFRDRLYREAAAAGVLSHPNIVTIFDIVEGGGLTAVAMEYIEGRPLAAIIAERAPLPMELAVEVLDQVCSALDFAGSQGIVHRDIKPANILLTSGGRVKITDFGVARLALSTMTQTGTVLGSPSYMSPEQVRGLPLDGRSDLFSAAVVLYEMMTRERPFAGDDIATTMYRIAHEPPTPPGQFNSAIGPEVSTILDRALAKDPGDRYQKGADFVAALRAMMPRASRKGAAAALASMATAPPPVPSVVAASPEDGATFAASKARGTPPVLPIPVSGSPTPAVFGGDGVVLAPIPEDQHGASPPASGPAGPGVALPTIPVPARPQAPAAPRPLVSGAGRKRRRLPVALVGAGGVLVVILAVAGVWWYRTGAGLQTPSGAPVSEPPAPAEPATAPPPAPVLPDGAVAPAGSGAVPADVSAMPGQGAAAHSPAPQAGSAGPSPDSRTIPQRGSALPRARGTVTKGTLPATPAAPAPPPQVLAPAPASQPAGGAPTRTPGRVYEAMEVDVRPSVVKQVAPVYPEDALQQRVQDTVVLKVLIGPGGNVEEIQVLRGSGKAPSLNAAAVAAVRQWMFEPARKSGKPVSCWYSVGLPFEPPR